jgi:hypothetical protein
MKRIYPEDKKKKKNPLVKEVWESKIKQKPSKNKHISYSQLSVYNKCPRLWELQYLRNLVPYEPSIYMVFGTAFHETLQTYLETLYMDKVKTANELNVDSLLYDNMVKAYKSAKAMSGHEHFSTQTEMYSFWRDGKAIMEWIKKKRAAYFSSKTMQLAGIETLLYQEIRPGVMFKGLIDLVFYSPNSDRWTVVDIKTSTRGWQDRAKKNPNLTAQVILYREYFSKQFNIPIDKIDVEYFIVKRQIPKNAEFASMQKRVQQFSPASGPRKTKQVIESMERFVADTIDENGQYIDKTYKCSSAFGKCDHCDVYPGVL